MSWTKKRLGDLATIQLGKMLDQKKNQGDYLPYLGNDNIQWNELKLDEVKQMRIRPEERERFRLQPNDILVCEGGDPGRCALWTSSEEMYYQKALHRVRVGKELDPRFLLYYLIHLGNTQAIRQYYTGSSTIKHLPNAAIKRVLISYPSIEKQKKIAEILSAYDSLIENSRKQIKLLEEAAQRLYKEWFIDLRFPGHETTAIDSETGLPKGWEEVAIRKALDDEIGGGWGEEAPTTGYSEIAYVIRATDISDVENGALLNVPLRFHKPSNLASRSLRDGDIIFEVSGGSREHGVGRNLRITRDLLDQLPHPVMCASFCKKMRPKSARLSLIIAESIKYAYLSEGLRMFEKRSAGNIINFHWNDFLDNFFLRIPPDGLLETYLKLVKPIYSMKSIKAKAINATREARDRLLPKLMSNEIEV